MEEKKGLGWKLHIVVVALILVFAALIMITLIKWDRSGKNVVLEDVEEGEFDYESLDYVFIVDPETLAAHGPDDGINNILCIGDDLLIKNDYVGGDSLLTIMQRGIPDSQITNLSLVGTRIADTQNAYLNNNVTYWQAANLYDVVHALCTQDFSLQKEALDNDAIISKEYYDALTAVDLDKIDTVFIIYSSVDYINASNLYDPEDDYNTATFDGALRASIKTLQSAYPHIRIVVGSPYLHGVIQGTEVLPASTVNYGNGTLSEYVMRSYNVAMECCVSYEDNYFGLINEGNVNDYCNADTLLNPGIDLIGDHIVEYFKRKY